MKMDSKIILVFLASFSISFAYHYNDFPYGNDRKEYSNHSPRDSKTEFKFSVSTANYVYMTLERDHLTSF